MITVDYRDIWLDSDSARIMAVILMAWGIGFIGVVAAILSSWVRTELRGVTLSLRTHELHPLLPGNAQPVRMSRERG